MSWTPVDLDAEFRERLLDSRAWEQTADHLLEAADLLGPKVDAFWEGQFADPVPPATSWRPWNDEFIAIFFMLSAFALENLMKACIVGARAKELSAQVGSSQRLPSILKNHDLYDLCVETGLHDLAKAEELLLRRLTRSSLWYGRYPVPLDPKGLAGWATSKSRNARISLTAYTGGDRADIRRLATELKAQLRALRRAERRSTQ